MPNNQSNLAKDIQKLIDQGLNQVADEATSQQITTYWQIGQRINQELENSQNPYHNSIIKDLSKEIDFDNSKLSRCLNFFKSYPQVPNDNSLNWSHYRVLITIKDNDLRQQFQSQIIQENWSKQNQSNPTQKNLYTTAFANKF